MPVPRSPALSVQSCHGQSHARRLWRPSAVNTPELPPPYVRTVRRSQLWLGLVLAGPIFAHSTAEGTAHLVLIQIVHSNEGTSESGQHCGSLCVRNGGSDTGRMLCLLDQSVPGLLLPFF